MAENRYERKVLIDGQELAWKLTRLFMDWEQGYHDPKSEWYELDALAVLSGKATETEEPATKVEQIELWLTGFQFPETFFLFTRDAKMFVLSSAKKVSHLEKIQNVKDGIHLMIKNNQDGNAVNFKKISNHIQSLSSKPRLGSLKSTIQHGEFATQCIQFLDGFDTKEIDVVIAKVMAVRTKAEMELMRCSSIVSCNIIKNQLINYIENVLDNEENQTHATISHNAEKFLEDKKLLDKLKEKYNIDMHEIELIYSNVQSGDVFDLRASSQPTSKNLSQSIGTIIVSLGSKYKEYCSNIVRTLILNGKKDHTELYSFTAEIMQVVISSLKPGTKFSSVYEMARKVIHEKKPNLLDRFVRSVGHVIGIDFRDPCLALNAKNDNVLIEKGMVFNISVGFSGLKTEDGKGFAVWLADTVEVPDTSDDPIILTEHVSRRIEHVSYELEDEADAEDETETVMKTDSEKICKPPILSNISKSEESLILKNRLRSRIGGPCRSAEEIDERNKKQLELRIKKVDEIKQRFKSGGGHAISDSEKSTRKLESVKAFNSPDDFPRDLRANKLYLDSKTESLLVPINGAHLPFHISMLKNVTCNPENDQKHFTLRINFQVPGSQTLTSKGEDNPLPELTSSNCLFVKEMLYRSGDGKHLQETFRSIKEMIKKVKQKETEGNTGEELANQEKIQQNVSGRRILLKDLMIRPNIHGTRKVIGMLEAHANGLRFTLNSRGQMDHIDITYANIKHAIFQPCEKELIVLIHFHLKSPIMVGKKKTSDVQFYTEAGTQTDDLENKRGRSYHDPDETQDEMREREMRRRLNNEFKRFVTQVESVARMEFDVPYRELMFSGVPAKSNVEILPTANCLVHLVEWPPFVLPLEDIEIVSFERVQHGLREFDVTFVFKDYTKPVKKIDIIPIEHLDNLKRWLNELDIVWYEGSNNLQWSNILKTILADTEAFLENDAFEGFLGDEVPEEAVNGEDDEGDDEYTDEDSYDASSDQSSDEDDSDDESLADESEDESYHDVDSDEEEGLSWDELEERAKKDDRKRCFDEREGDIKKHKTRHQ